jgi:peptide/nickel transport system ATP-binding protein
MSGRTQPAALAFEGVGFAYPGRPGRAGRSCLAGFDLSIAAGEFVGLVGRSGAGKTTAIRLAVGLERPDSGRVSLFGSDLASVRGRERAALLTRVGLVPQDVFGSLSPTMHVARIVSEPLEIAGMDPVERRDRIRETLCAVGLGDPRVLERAPGQLSGGERQRVALARALAGRPRLLVIDEPTSMLDALHQADVYRLLRDRVASHDLAILLVTHDLARAASICMRLAVLSGGRIVDAGPTADLLRDPREEATRELIGAARVLSAPLAARPN